jgi:hypothetical protein
MKTLRVINNGIWLAAATMVLAYVWGGILDAIPRPPDAFAIWLSQLFGVEDREDLGRLEVLYMLVVSFILVTGTYWALSLWRGRQKP